MSHVLFWKYTAAQECDGRASSSMATADGASSEASRPPYTMEDKGYVWAVHPDGRKKQLIGSFAGSAWITIQAVRRFQQRYKENPISGFLRFARFQRHILRSNLPVQCGRDESHRKGGVQASQEVPNLQASEEAAIQLRATDHGLVLGGLHETLWGQRCHCSQKSLWSCYSALMLWVYECPGECFIYTSLLHMLRSVSKFGSTLSMRWADILWGYDALTAFQSCVWKQCLHCKQIDR